MNRSEISRWQEAIASLPDKQFFNTMRLYLGEIKTPYNKQRLTEQLASFIRREENLQSILTLMDSFDVEILTALSLIPKASQETLIQFFSGAYTITELYAEIINLTERLLIYTDKDEISGKEFLAINPLLRDSLNPYLDTKIIFPDFKAASISIDDVFTISPNFLSAFLSYIKVRGISCKADGTIKKNDKNRLAEIFPGRDKLLQLLMTAFVNLSLVTESDKGYSLEASKVKAFAALSQAQQYALLCAAAVSRFSRDGLKKEAQLLLDCLSSIPESGFTRAAILRLAFLAGTYTQDGNALARKSRFSMILEAARQEAGNDAVQNAELLDRMIDCAMELGLLQKLGKTEDGLDLYKTAEALSNEDSTHSLQERPKTGVLNIDSTFTVTLLPGLSLSQLLPLTDFMMIKKCEVVTEFEITRQSAASGFDAGWNPDSIFDCLSNYTNYQIPQNLKINITEWYNSYSSAMLYHGYVLKVRDNNIALAENNPNIKKYIKEKLAEGIYLLSIPAGQDISDFIAESSLDFLGNVKSSETKSEFSSFPLLRDGHKIGVLAAGQNKAQADSFEIKKTSLVEADKLLKKLKGSLASQDMEKQLKESLTHRISSRLILSENQLKTAAVRTEILEADGMDFSGKVHLIEAAVKDDDLMELQMPAADGKGDFFTIVGHPLGISKQPGEAVMRFEVEPTKEIENFLVSRITHLRRLRF
ncbi:helicase-associated domain-containing protein [Treponema bryantii]|uniref:helicase-associated domain-containing protein n=1 Tax=Treponema bryantii TaxID=163 RepID=UPI0003B62839|nr:helicase-associated domain-containing protein [Treponema bryantii]